MAPINHVFTNAHADVGDPTIVRPSDWNSIHAYTLQDAVSLSGNTAGALANISTGTLYLAGGNNVTLSQNGNSVTISAFTQTLQTQSRFNLTLSGNTDGALALISSGVMTLAGGDNITLSQAGNAVTISGAAGGTGGGVPIATTVASVASANSVGTVTRYAPEDHRHAGLYQLSLGGNTSGATTAGAGSFMLAGGNNVTLSAATAAGGMTVTISAANETQTVPPIATAVKGVSSIGSTGTVTRFAPEDHQHAGLYQVSVGGNTAGATTAGAGSLHLAGGPNITLSGATAAGGMTLSVSAAAAGAGAPRPYFLPTDTIGTTRNLSASMSTIFLMPIVVPTDMTIDRIVMLNSMATNVTSNVSNTTYAFTISRGAALYSYNGTSLALASSSSATPAISYTSNISTASLSGIRLHSLPLAATMVPGNWWVGFSFSSVALRSAAGGSSATGMNNSYYIGLNSTVEDLGGPWAEAADLLYKVTPFQGYYTVVSAAFPASIAHSHVSQSDSVNLWFRLQGAITG